MNDSIFGLDKGLFADDYQSFYFKKNGYPCSTDFQEFASRLNINEKRFKKLIEPLIMRQPLVETLIQRSYLDQSIQKAYLVLYNTRRNHLSQK